MKNEIKKILKNINAEKINFFYTADVENCEGFSKNCSNTRSIVNANLFCEFSLNNKDFCLGVVSVEDFSQLIASIN